LMIWNHRCLDLRVVGFLVMVIIINSFWWCFSFSLRSEVSLSSSFWGWNLKR
jgi:hypothetical protein